MTHGEDDEKVFGDVDTLGFRVGVQTETKGKTEGERYGGLDINGVHDEMIVDRLYAPMVIESIQRAPPFAMQIVWAIAVASTKPTSRSVKQTGSERTAVLTKRYCRKSVAGDVS
jgi:hypothetical protein